MASECEPSAQPQTHSSGPSSTKTVNQTDSASMGPDKTQVQGSTAPHNSDVSKATSSFILFVITYGMSAYLIHHMFTSGNQVSQAKIVSVTTDMFTGKCSMELTTPGWNATLHGANCLPKSCQGDLTGCDNVLVKYNHFMLPDSWSSTPASRLSRLDIVYSDSDMPDMTYNEQLLALRVLLLLMFLSACSLGMYFCMEVPLELRANAARTCAYACTGMCFGFICIIAFVYVPFRALTLLMSCNEVSQARVVSMVKTDIFTGKCNMELSTPDWNTTIRGAHCFSDGVYDRMNSTNGDHVLVKYNHFSQQQGSWCPLDIIHSGSDIPDFMYNDQMHGMYVVLLMWLYTSVGFGVVVLSVGVILPCVAGCFGFAIRLLRNTCNQSFKARFSPVVAGYVAVALSESAACSSV